ncbi:MAG: CotS family spore coat protein [Bacillota bacterium]|nr:CotS family spore coat protein [Bacillota bacterium]
MKHSRILKLNDELTDREEQVINKVLGEYDIKAVTISKARSAYKIQTNNSCICLKRMRHGKDKPKNGSVLVDNLYAIGFNNTPQYIRTIQGLLFVRYHGWFFYATEWIDGEECTLSNLSEAADCIKLLAHFHNSVKKIDTKNLRIKNNLKNWSKIFKDGISDLEKFKRIMKMKKIRNQFDELYEKNMDIFYNRSQLALAYLNNSQYYKLSREAEANKTICHNSFYYQNILKKDGQYYIIDLDSIIIDLQINDVGKLIRRLMFKKEYSWDFSKAKVLIEAYNSINKLTKDELEVMLALIIYPHKFWKLGKKRYIKRKNWSESKYMHKLKKLIDYEKKQQTFIDEYIRYLDIYNA